MSQYVHDGVEVMKTGREATRSVGTGPRARTLTLVEIMPVDKTFDWRKWVDPAVLFTVKPDEGK